MALKFWEPVTVYLQKNYAITTLLATTLEKHFPIPVFDNAMPSLVESGLNIYRGFAYHLAGLLIAAIVFILIVIVVAAITGIIWQILSLLLNWGLFGVVNRIGGVAFELGKTAIIFSFLICILEPLIQTLATVGLSWAILAQSHLNASLMVPHLESIFNLMGKLTGINTLPII